MTLQNPHIIVEGSTQYELGTLRGQEILYDFEKILMYLQIKGKLLFGKNFRIYDEDLDIVIMLCHYFIKDLSNCQKWGLDPYKGLLLSGPVGCGKTSLMKLLKYIVPHRRPYSIIPCRNIVFSFGHLGYKTIEDFGCNGFFCFDDLGVEPPGRHYGQDCNVMGEVLLSRYDFFLETTIPTHATTNLNADELETRYGSRVRSRMRQLFNLIAFDKASLDKRK